MDEGYDLEVRAGHLLVKNVPYVDAQKAVCRGTLVSELTQSGGVTGPPGTHVAMFVGGHPCNKDGAEIAQIKHGSGRQDLGHGLVVDHSFSNKPADGYRDYYEKMTRYIEVISAPALSIDQSLTAKNFGPVSVAEEESVFHYYDTASSRAGITAVTAKLAIGSVAIVGVGGTGSYVLDLVAKTPVQKIHIFDGDRLYNHNAFRSPGAPSFAQLEERPLKVNYFAELYSRMHRGIVPHARYVDGSNAGELRGMGFVFLCLDRGAAKREIVERLVGWGVPFVDAGMGVDAVDGQLGGVLRVTAVTPRKHDHVRERISFAEGGDDDYSSNIQIADLNAMTAVLAVGWWKKHFGFYRDYERAHHSTYTTDCHLLTGEEAA
jgi:hypothetical protein